MTIADVLKDHAQTVADRSCFVNARETARLTVIVSLDATGHQRNALSRALYRATDFDHWDKNSNPKTSDCRWVIVMKTKETTDEPARTTMFPPIEEPQ
jgi:hypothetical protein